MMIENPKISRAKIECREKVREKWGDKAARHLHFVDGFTLLAQQGNALIGMLAVQMRPLPASLADCTEAFIDIIEVDDEYRRRHFGSRLVMTASRIAQEAHVYQLGALRIKVRPSPFGVHWASASVQQLSIMENWRYEASL